MNTPKLRVICASVLCAIFVVGLFAGTVSPYPYAKQFRERPNAAPSSTHLLGTDSLGRDLFARFGAAPEGHAHFAAALLATLLAGIFGGLAGLVGGWCEKFILAATDLSMAIPLLFVLLALRALLPLDISPVLSVIATFALLGLLGWPSSLRVVWAATKNLRNCDFLLLARATGCGRWRMIVRHLLPNLRPVLFAQFWISIPVFVLTEATLSMLGLGVIEPLPSWGNLLRGLEDISAVTANPWRLTPLVLLALVVICFQLILPAQEETA